MAIAMHNCQSGPRRGVSAHDGGLDPIPPPNREDETMQDTVDQVKEIPAPHSLRIIIFSRNILLVSGCVHKLWAGAGDQPPRAASYHGATEKRCW